MFFQPKVFVTIVAMSFLIGPAIADDDDGNNVRGRGAVCNGQNDDTAAFQTTIDKTPAGGVLRVPHGKCVVSGTLVVSRPITIAGVGLGSQIYGKNAKTILQFVGVNDAVVRDLYLGSASNAPGVALLELVNSHHNRIDNVTMLGGYYGLHLFGSLLNTIIDLKTGINFNSGHSAFFGAVAVNQYWVYAERDHTKHISSNANTFIAPSLEGGTNGIYLGDLPDPTCAGCIRNGEGSLTITGGAIEGLSQTALTVDSTFHPISVSGVHFEANQLDVLINQAVNIRLSSIVSLGRIRVQGALTRNIQITDSIVQQLSTDTTVKRFQLQNITTDLQCTGTSGIVPAFPWDISVIYTNIGLNCT